MDGQSMGLALDELCKDRHVSDSRAQELVEKKYN